MKRRKTIRAGQVTYSVVYTVPNPRDAEYKRKRIKQISEQAIARMNCNSAARKLELLSAANFGMRDLIITLTYRDADLPVDYKAAQQQLGKFLRWLREHRRARGEELCYIYITEGLHGDKRLHHHLYLNATGDDLEIIRSLWRWGDDVQLSYISDKGYEGWAQYLSKERRESSLNGKLMYVPSRNLRKPIVESELVDDDITVEAPPGAVDVVESGDRNEFASFKYVKYRMPDHNRKSSVSHFSDSKHTITYGKGRRKCGAAVDSPPKSGYNKNQDRRTRA